ncbi:ParA family protein (plasmid) [Asticcacaulis sp. DW145]|uniref:AAA family ATPase n=1 Tax=Asticcacaulis sp. DW145 TaxID=3095608 RepID=UPI00308BD10D|nr:ParA family protein [Asticcacaulis sp. DW145]
MTGAPVISFATSKGGSGKSTALIILASVFAKEGGKVAVIDTDPNETVWRWANKDGRPANITPYQARNEDLLMDAIDAARASGHHLILIDVEGRASALGNLAMSSATLTVIPVRPSEPDGVEASKTVKAIRAIERAIGQERRYCIVINGLNGAIRSRTFHDVVATFQESNIPMAAHLVDREIYRRVLMEGGTIYGLEGVTEKQIKMADEEAYLFADNIASFVGLRRPEAGRATREAESAIEDVMAKVARAVSDTTEESAETIDGEASRVIEKLKAEVKGEVA